MLAIQERIANAFNRLGFPDPEFIYGFQIPNGEYQAHLIYDCPNLDVRDFLAYSDEVIFEVCRRGSGRGGGSQNGSRINLHFFLVDA